ncbi:MAG: helix-turn-helix transcriptional regulator [Clostridiales bacterium]|nr:helix-turn-helix transcriptional regulator [Clostridiales bacterium]MBO4579980.1 helix-turn-helix transcriptional regulator [Clostridiales bacterium]
MDQIKIGKFIASLRKEQGLTQAVLADRLGITDRAVSKWETGKCLPDASVMPELCDILKISVSELFAGERIDMENLRESNEKLLLELKEGEERSNRKLLHIRISLIVISLVVYMAILIIASFLFKMELLNFAIPLFITAFVLLISLVTIAILIERDAGYFECPECGERYVPTMRAFIVSPHMGTTHHLKCPKCGKKAWHKKVMTK